MALVRLTNTASILVEAPAARSWALLLSGQQLGAATITLGSRSPAAAPAYLNANGGSLVEIGDEHGAGVWRGLVTGLAFSAEGLTVQASVFPVILTRLVTGFGRGFGGVPAGVIARRLLAALLPGCRLPLALGTVNESGPLIASFDWHFDYAWDLLSRLMDLSGQELRHDIGTGAAADTLSWGPPLAPREPAPLVAEVDFLDWQRSVALEERADRVIVTNGDTWFPQRAVASDTRFWPATAVVKDNSLKNRQLVRRAGDELATRGRPVVTLAGAVPPARFGLREGSTVTVISGGGAFGTASDQCRVLARALREDGSLMDLTLQVIDSRTTVATLARSVALAAKQQEMAARLGRAPYGG